MVSCGERITLTSRSIAGTAEQYSHGTWSESPVNKVEPEAGYVCEACPTLFVVHFNATK